MSESQDQQRHHAPLTVVGGTSALHVATDGRGRTPTLYHSKVGIQHLLRGNMQAAVSRAAPDIAMRAHLSTAYAGAMTCALKPCSSWPHAAASTWPLVSANQVFQMQHADAQHCK